ncbi:MAG: hypothetical protein Q9172_001245 [Xanthocarpia lactea]
MTIRTACSSSLVALHEACMSIRRNECESAIVGGASLIMTPGSTTSLSEQNVLSKDGSCNTFSVDANGYARGEAITAIYIKKLEDALRDGNPIRAVIRGTATNHGGKTPGMTVPSADAQEKLIRRAYHEAGITAFSDTAFVECHGTGTPIGDPIEAEAVGRVFGRQGVYIGSVKPNLGHTEGASGLLSVIKTVLALENRTIPPNIKSDPPNLAIPFKSARLTVPIDPIPWPVDRLERASVNSFGISGTNAHVIIDSASSFHVPTISQGITSGPQLLLFSANSQKSLKRLVDNYRHMIDTEPENISDIAYTLANRRQHLSHRTFAIANGGVLGPVYTTTKSTESPDVIMTFSGQGAQWPRMGRGLLDSNLVFRDSIRRMDQYLSRTTNCRSEWTIEGALRGTFGKSQLDSAEFSQPLCAAIQIALVDTFASVGILPSAVVGHSSGEIAAAYAAGILTLEEAIANATYRGVATSMQKRSGAMAAVGLSAGQMAPYLSPQVTVACDNAPSSVTISGETDAVDEIIKEMHNLHVPAKRLQVDKAYHSHQMIDIGEQYRTFIETVTSSREPKIPFFSSVTGGLISSAKFGPEYWQNNLESPVLFRAAIECILHHQVGKNAVFLEIGPHSTLAGPLRQIITHQSATASYVTSMVRNEDCLESLLAAVGKLYSLRVPVDLCSFIATGSCLPDLPRYPWDHDERYWYESRLSKEYRQRQFPHHDLLGSKVPESTDFEVAWRNLFHLDSAPWVRDHMVGDDIVFPFAGYIAMAGEAARQLTGVGTTYRLRHVIISTAFVVSEGAPTEMITTLRRQRLTDIEDSKWWEFTVATHNGYTWTKHCTGLVTTESETQGSYQTCEIHPRKVDIRKWFDSLQRAGLILGPAFRNLANVSANTITNQATADVLNQSHMEAHGYQIHPTRIDSALQLLGIASANGLSRKFLNRLPVSCESIDISRTCSNIVVGAKTRHQGGSIVGELEGITDGLTVLKVTGLKLSNVERSDPLQKSNTHAAAYQVWRPDIDFMDLGKLIKPSIDRVSYMPLLEELGWLCLVYSQNRRGASTSHKPHLQKLHQWIDSQIMALDGPLLQDSGEDAISDNIDNLVYRLSATPASSAATILRCVCKNIDAILSGDVASWEDLVDSKTAAAFYELVGGCDTSSLIKHLGHSNPNLRVLQISPWEDGPSAHLDSLTTADGRPLYSTYTFTSKGFVAAPEGDQSHRNITYASLDIGTDPLEQGFERHQYDLVIANNALHTTTSINASLENIKTLLHPSGSLLLQELCPTSKWLNFIGGTQAGWWCGYSDNRQSEPYISTRVWLERTVAAGYVGSDSLVLDSQEPFQLNTIMVLKPAATSPPIKSVGLLCASHVSKPGAIHRELVSQGFDVTVYTIEQRPAPGQDIIALLDQDGPFIDSLSSNMFKTFQDFLSNIGDSGILWVTQHSQMQCRNPQYAQIIGLARTIRSELLLDIATCETDNFENSAPQVIQVFQKFQHRDVTHTLQPDFEYSISEGVINVGRIYPFTLTDELLASPSAERATLEIEVPGRLNTLRWVGQPGLPPLQPDEVEVEMYAFSLNFRDIVVAMKIVDLPNPFLGSEGAGVVRRIGSEVKTVSVGDRVAIIDRGVFSSIVITLELLCVKLPDGLGFEEGSTMFFPYLTAMQSLITIGRLEKGQSVLIHSACGGVGLAAVQLAQVVEAEIYATVGSEEKVQHLMTTFNIPRERIFNSRDASFVKGLMQATHNKGVDLVLNSLSGELLHATWQCVAPFGRMVEIGKRDLLGFGQLDMNPFLANRSYSCVDIEAFREKPLIVYRALQSILQLYQQGSIRPIQPVKVFDAPATCDAFRYMQRGQHIGRICVRIRENPERTSLESCVQSPRRMPLIHGSAAYLLVGGLGGLGRAISLWMVEHGARHLIYLSRNADSNLDFAEELRTMGCQVQLVRGSVTEPADVARAVQGASAPIRGILQLSMVLSDENFLRMTMDQWNAARCPKVQGTWNLHNATVSAHLDLDFFVLFSSLSGIIGQPGQANYAAGNTFLDAFARYRTSIGLPASVIDVGAVGDIGYISGKPDHMQQMVAAGFHSLGEQDVLDALTVAMAAPRNIEPSRNQTQWSSFVDPRNFILGLGSKIPLQSASNRAVWKRDRRMAIYHNDVDNDVDDSISSTSLKSFIASAKTDRSLLRDPNSAGFLATEIGKRLFDLLMRPEEDLNISLSLSDLGMDSLVGIELCAWWKQVFGFKISVLELLGMGNLEALGQHAAEGLEKECRAQQGDTG